MPLRHARKSRYKGTLRIPDEVRGILEDWGGYRDAVLADIKEKYPDSSKNRAGVSWPKGRQSTPDATYHYLDLRFPSALLSIILYPHGRVS